MAGQDHPRDDDRLPEGLPADASSLRWAALIVSNVRDITPWLPQLMEVLGP